MRKKNKMLKVASLVACSGLTFSFVGNCAEGIPRGMGQTIGGVVVTTIGLVSAAYTLAGFIPDICEFLPYAGGYSPQRSGVKMCRRIASAAFPIEKCRIG